MKLIYFLSLIMIFTFQANSQNRVEVETAMKRMSKGEQMAFIVMIPNSKTNEIESLWRKYVNVRPAGERIDNLNTQIGNIFRSKENRVKRDRLKMVKTGEELYVRSVDLGSISSFPMDVYAIITQLPEGSRLYAFFQYTDSVFINETNVEENRLALLKDYVRNFGVEAYKTVVDNNIKVANKEVSREQNRLKDLQSDINREEKSITRNEEAIQQFKARITELQGDSARMIDKLASKKDEFSAMAKDSAEYDVAKEELRGMEKEKLRAAREIRTLKNRIKSKELDIESAKNQIAANELEIDNQQKVIVNKQEVAEQLIREKGGIE